MGASAWSGPNTSMNHCTVFGLSGTGQVGRYQNSENFKWSTVVILHYYTIIRILFGHINHSSPGQGGDRQTDEERGGCANKRNMCPKVTVVSIRPSQRERGRERANAATGEEGDHQHMTSTSDPRLSCPHLVQPSLGIASFFGPTSPSPPPLCVDMINGTSKLFDLSSSFTLGLPLLSSPLLSLLSLTMHGDDDGAQLADIQWSAAGG